MTAAISCEQKRYPTISAIQYATAQEFGISLVELMSHRRSREPARARQVAMYLARMLTQNSLPTIGRCFDRHHTTILHGVRHIGYLTWHDPKFGKRVDSLQEQLERWA